MCLCAGKREGVGGQCIAALGHSHNETESHLFAATIVHAMNVVNMHCYADNLCKHPAPSFFEHCTCIYDTRWALMHVYLFIYIHMCTCICVAIHVYASIPI